MNSYWIESFVFNYKTNDFENSSVLVMELYDIFKLYDCKNCEYLKENYTFDNKCFYCFTEYLKFKVIEDKYIDKFFYEIDDMKDFEFETCKYMALGFEMKEIYRIAKNNNLLIFCKEISEKDKNIINKYINENLDIFLNNNFIY
jgi:hypothetical protein